MISYAVFCLKKKNMVYVLYASKLQNTQFIAILNKIQMTKSCFENSEHTLRPSFRLFKESASGHLSDQLRQKGTPKVPYLYFTFTAMYISQAFFFLG